MSSIGAPCDDPVDGSQLHYVWEKNTCTGHSVGPCCPDACADFTLTIRGPYQEGIRPSGSQVNPPPRCRCSWMRGWRSRLRPETAAGRRGCAKDPRFLPCFRSRLPHQLLHRLVGNRGSFLRVSVAMTAEQFGRFCREVRRPTPPPCYPPCYHAVHDRPIAFHVLRAGPCLPLGRICLGKGAKEYRHSTVKPCVDCSAQVQQHAGATSVHRQALVKTVLEGSRPSGSASQDLSGANPAAQPKR